MKEKIRNEIKQVLVEIENSKNDQIDQLRTFHYNVHHIVYNPINEKSCLETVGMIKNELNNVDWFSS